MLSVHRQTVVHSGEVHTLPPWLALVLLGGGTILFHVVRAVRVDSAVAGQWVLRRGLPADPRCTDLVQRYLERLRWSRVVSTVMLVLGCAASFRLASAFISFASLPVLLSIVAAEVLAPDPRRGRLRVAALQRRPRSFFAPLPALTFVRVVLAAAIVLSLGAATVGTWPHPAVPWVHAGVMLVGAAALEGALQRISVRALPDRQPDLAVDTAMRVASARSSTAAGLLFGVFGLFAALSLSGVFPLVHHRTAAPVVGPVLNIALLGVLAVAITLIQPLASWKPRRTG